jgi:hypothetical protein
VQRIQAVFFHQGTPWLGKVVLRTKAGLAALREAAAATFIGLSGTIADPHWPASWQSPAPPPRPGGLTWERGMGTQHFAISYDGAWLLTVVGMGPRSSGVEVDSDEIRVRMGSAFRLAIPRGSVRSVSRDPALAGRAAWGVHAFSGRWFVNGSAPIPADDL